MPIATLVVSPNPTHGELYLIQHYVMKFVSDLRQVCDFLRVLRFPPPIKLTAMIHDTTEILLKVALNTINTQSNPSWSIIFLNKYKYLLQRTSQNCTVTIRESHLRDILIGF